MNLNRPMGQIRGSGSLCNGGLCLVPRMGKKALDPCRRATVDLLRLKRHLIPLLFPEIFLHRCFVEVLGLALYDPKGARGALAQTSPQAVTIYLRRKPGFSVNNLQGPFGTGGDTLSTSIAQLIVDFNDLSLDFHAHLQSRLISVLNQGQPFLYLFVPETTRPFRAMDLVKEALWPLSFQSA